MWWHGHRVLGLDGRYLNLPDTEETRREFSVQTNHSPGAEQVQAWASVLYELRNEVGLSAALGPKPAEKPHLFAPHLAVPRRGDGGLGDRAYADYSVMATILAWQWHFVIRFPRQSFTAVNTFWASAVSERVVTLTVPASARTYGTEQQWPSTLRVRLLKVRLPNGEVEGLGTDLLRARRYPAAEFKTVSGWRWQQETYQDRIKNIFEIERFRGKSIPTIKQAFYGVIFLATFESILSKPAQAELSAPGEARACRTIPPGNRAVS